MAKKLSAPVKLEELVAQLEELAGKGDYMGAMRVEQAILQMLAADADRDRQIERRVREAMAAFREPGSKPSPAGSAFAATRPREASKGDSDGGVDYPVWFGTNRAADPAGGFTNERSGVTTFGRVDVHIPVAHWFGEIGSSFWKKLKRRDFRDDKLRLVATALLDRAAFFAAISQMSVDARVDSPVSHGLVFIHGYNVSFENAAIRAAQIGCDLKVPGATAFFSWPSRGSVLAYPVDEATIEASEGALTQFLVDFALNCGADQVDVIAHSMGNRGLLRALQRIAANAELGGRVKFGQVILAAPDVDRDLFLELAGLYSKHAARTTLYASDRDLPVHASSKLHDAPRAGYYRPYTVAPGVDTIAVPAFNIDLLGHGYFAQAAAMLHDIFDLLHQDSPPKLRQRIAEGSDGDAVFWKLVR